MNNMIKIVGVSLVVFTVIIIAFKDDIQRVEIFSEVDKSSNETVADISISSEESEDVATVKENPNDSRISKNRPEFVNFHEEIKEWKKNRFGYYAYGDQSGYSAYDIETLEALAEQNDFAAIHMLAAKYLEARDSKKWNATLHKAAALGSTYALIRLSSSTHSSIDNESGPRNTIVERASFLQAALIRGDKSAVKSARSLLKHPNVQLTEAEKTRIQTNGIKLYHRLEAERKKMGLSKFDNSIPSYVDEFFNYSITDEKMAYFTGGESPIFITSL